MLAHLEGRLRLLPALIALLTLGAPALGQSVGEVLVQKKISDTQGGPFRPILQPRDQLGRSVRSIGDVDGDGIMDMVSGVHKSDDGGSAGSDSDVGAVWIFFMDTNGQPKGRQKISLTQGNFTGDLDDGDEFGRAVGKLGDLDLDGVPDIVVGATCDDDGGFNRGAAWILFLNSDGTVKAHQKISDTEGNFTAVLEDEDEFGRGFALLDDWDGNGVRELAVAATLDNDDGENTGAFYVLFMNRDGTVLSHQKVSDLEGNFTANLKPHDTFGMAVARLGDVDGDGVTDICSTALGDDTGGVQTGVAYILFMNTDGTVKDHAKISASRGLVGALERRDQFGFNADGILDHDGDGVPDVAIGAALDDDGGGNGENSNRGAVYVIFLESDGKVKAFQKISADFGNLMTNLGVQDWFGTGVGFLGDLDGDGFGDISVGSRFDDDGGVNQGALYNLFLQGAGGTAPAAEFSADVTSGDPGLIVTFTDESTGTVNSWTWDFGDGGRGSRFQSPQKKYDAPGTYTVTLSVSGPVGGDVETKVGYITVGAIAPVAEFSGTPTSGPAPLTVQFTDLSTGGPTSWAWDFGDGGMSTEQDPSHEYTTPGTYQVSLTASNGNGSDDEIKAAYVTVTDPAPVPDFTGNPLVGPAPLSVAFADATTGNVTSWAWDFGDGGMSTEQDPTHEYTVPGTYTVALTATGPGGGNTETKVDYVTVDEPPPVAGFSGNPQTGDAPLSVDFTDESTGAVTAWVWDFGDGSGSTEQNPTHLYAGPGMFTVVLTATGPGGSDDETKVDYVVVSTPPPPVADFSGDTTNGVAPLTVNFTDASTGHVTAWSWTFGDGGTSSLQNPSHEYTIPGTYDVTLTATGLGGSDPETKVGYVTVTDPPPVADFSGTPTSGAIPLTVDFTDLTTGNVTSWSWTFGDGGSSTLQNPSHEYTVPGTYDVTLTSTGPGGSDPETKVGYVVVTDPPPVADFSGTPTSGDAPLTVAFTDLTTGNVTSWSWTFGDGGSSTEQNPSYEYATPGTYDVALTATGPGGPDVNTKLAYVQVDVPPAPTAGFSGNPTTGDAPLQVVFTDETTGQVDSWSWDFGDGNGSTEQSPTHTYDTPDTYTVTLTATGLGGPDVETKVDYVTAATPPPPVADFSGDPTSGLAPLTVAFTDLSTGHVDSWSWDFGDGGMSTEQNPSHEYITPGKYGVTLTATGLGGPDVETKASYIIVNEPPPVADFSGTPTSGAVPLTVDFTDLSTGNVTSWAWTFGDGGTSSLQDPSHEYMAPGTYDVTLTATGPGGSDPETKVGYVTVTDPAPVAEFSGTPLSGDAPLSVVFTDETTGNVTSWSWDFGDGSGSTEQNPTHEYGTPGTFDVSLTATGPGGPDVETKLAYVTADVPPEPVAEFSADPTSGVAPLTVAFTDQTTGNVSSWSWAFGDGGTSTEQNPSHEYTVPGTYDVSLTATGLGGADVETKVGHVTVDDPPPVADFSGTPTSGPVPLTVDFTDLSTGNVTSWSWTFGDGGSSTEQNPSHEYLAMGTYDVTLTATGPGGSDPETKVGYVTVTQLPPVAEFVGAPLSGDAPLVVSFTDQTTGNVTSWSWVFGDGGTSTEQSPSHSYDSPGTYSVTLTSTGPGGSDGETKVDYVQVGTPPPPLALGEVLARQKISATQGGPVFPTLDAEDQFGRGIARLGDVDGDGVDDIAVGVQKDDDGGSAGQDSNVGALWIVFMQTDGRAKAVQKISATQGNFTGDLDDGDEFGRAVGAIGDLDDDGTPDVLAGAGFDDDGGNDRGALWVLFLNTDGTVKAHQKVSSTTGGLVGPLDNGDEFGRSFSCLGDLDGDGVEDAAVGAVRDDDGGTNAGAFYVLFLNSDGTVKAEQKVTENTGGFGGGLSPADAFAFDLTKVGDVDGDGVTEIAVGANGDDTLGNGTGAVWLLFMNTDGTVADHRKISAARGMEGALSAQDQFGYAVTDLGDLDADGVPDLAVGAALDDDGGTNRGAVYVLFLDSDGGVRSFQKISSLAGNLDLSFDVDPLEDVDQFGASLAGLGDLNRDGYMDVAVGARLDDDGAFDAGAIYMLGLQGTAVAPTASFTGGPNSGIAPLSVAFEDTSTGSVASWAWDFGDGDTSSLENPTHEYQSTGSFDVSLTVGGPAGVAAITQTDFVVVSPPTPPIPDFVGSPTSGVAPLDVDFTDLTSGHVTSWAWTFGDGGTSSEQDPSYQYASPGTYTVALTATGAGGMATETKTAYVTVSEPPPVAEFSGTPTSGNATLQVTFTDLSSGGPVTGWSWDFGDGGSSTAQHPVHDYTVVGTYDVTLTVTGPGGMDAETKTAYVDVLPPPPAPDFSATPLSGDAPLSVDFTNLTTGAATSFSWDFGDGGSSTESDPTHLYTVPDLYTVVLTATGPGGSAMETKVGYVDVTTPPPPVADFSGTPLSGEAPLLVAFSDLSTGGPVTGWSWSFGDGGTSTLSDPGYTYQAPGDYTVSLTVTGPGGMDTLMRTDYVSVSTPPPPNTEFTATPISGPAPLSVGFTDQSTGHVTSWSWAFGDGGTSTEQHPTHEFTAAGDYDVTLTTTGSGGSTPLTKNGYVSVAEPLPVAEFSGDVTSGPAPHTVNFTDLSSGMVTSWDWTFGDGGTSTAQNPSHEYASVGQYTVSLTVTGPGGSDGETKVDYVDVLPPPPTAEFTATPLSGSAPLSVDFTDLTTGTADSWSWTFGDGGSSTLQNPTHEYQSAGLYTVSLTASGPGGQDMETKVGYVDVDGTCVAGPLGSYTTVTNVIYRQGYGGGCNASAPCLDIYIPDDPLPCSPTVVFIHGGGFVMGTKGGYAANGRNLARRGIYAVLINYDLSTFEPCNGPTGSGSFPQAMIDVKDAIDWVHREGTAMYGLPDEVVAAGTSAGAILAALAGVTQGPGEDLFESSPTGDYRVDLVVMFSGLANFVSLGCEGNVWPSGCLPLCPGPDAGCGFPAGCAFTGGYPPGYPCESESTNCREITGIEAFLGEVWPNAGTPAGVDCTDTLSLPAATPTMPTGIPWYDGNPHFWVSGEEPPFEIFHASCDALAPFSFTQDFESELLGAGVPVSLTVETPSSSCDIGCQHGGPKMYGTTGVASRIRDAILANF